MTKIKVGGRVEDTRAKSIFNPDPKNSYSGIFGTVTAVSADEFRVRWDGYEIGYAFEFLDMGIKVVPDAENSNPVETGKE